MARQMSGGAKVDAGPAHPQMVALAREAKGWTQRELAERSSLSQGYLSKVELGLVDLVDGHLKEVANALDCPAALLTDNTPVRGLEVTCLHHRRRHTTMTAKTKKQIEAVTHLTRVTVEGLLPGLREAHEALVRRLDIDMFGDPATVAGTLRRAWQVPAGPIGNLTELMESVGIVVIERPLGTRGQDAVSSWPHEAGRAPIMLLNTGLPGDRQRFTLAHELGHLVMHRLPRPEQEEEANLFASEFLAPGDEIGPQLEGLTTRDFPRLLALKAHWGMSVAALIRRAKDLDAISDRQYREFHVQLGRLGWRTLEPGTLTPEHPQTLDRVIAARTGAGETIDDLARAAVMTPASFIRHYALAPKTPTGTEAWPESSHPGSSS